MIIKRNFKDITIRDLRIGTIVKIHLCNDSRGDKGIVNCEIIALFNSHSSEYFEVGGQEFAVSYEGQVWTCSSKHVKEIVKY